MFATFDRYHGIHHGWITRRSSIPGADLEYPSDTGQSWYVGFAGIVPSVAITMLGRDSMTELQLFLRKHLRFVSGPRFAVTLLWTDGHLVRAATCGRPAQTYLSLGRLRGCRPRRFCFGDYTHLNP